MRLKIISDGTPCGTRLINIETGQPLRGVRRIEWSISAAEGEQVAVAKIELTVAAVDVVAEKVVDVTKVGRDGQRDHLGD